MMGLAIWANPVTDREGYIHTRLFSQKQPLGFRQLFFLKVRADNLFLFKKSDENMGVGQ